MAAGPSGHCQRLEALVSAPWKDAAGADNGAGHGHRDPLFAPCSDQERRLGKQTSIAEGVVEGPLPS